MRISRNILSNLWIVIFCLAFQSLKAQLGYDLEIKKPEPYENRLLKAEKSQKKKFTTSRRIFQNTFTHYNYFFNANNKINGVIEMAKEQHKDDYSELLPFYNYSLETTAGNQGDLDSVIYKSKTGILMHDLRNDWIDDMYLLWGAAYFLQKDFDSAYQMFQFINWAFAEKEKDNYYKYIGSRMDGNNALSIATRENETVLKRMISDPPSRNTAFIWQIRTLIESGAMPEAASLIVTLKKDPNFPERLHSSLEEVQAYWFYKQGLWDSTAGHLVNALDNARTKQEKARWEYLAAQLYERSGKTDTAALYYTKALDHTPDPVMDVYARLNLIRINKTGGDNYISQNIDELVKMARKERFADYRDVIYFTAAQMEMERDSMAAAQKYLQKAAQWNTTNPASRNRSYLKLADVYFARKNYPAAASFYDSVQVAELMPDDTARVTLRQGALSKIVKDLSTINRQDSLQKIAAMPEEERTDYLKKLARQLRRQKGLKGEDSAFVSDAQNLIKTDEPAQLFPSDTKEKGEWYFYNPPLKTTGATTFKRVWGNRPNVDNWRRASDVTAELRDASPDNTRPNQEPVIDSTIEVSGISYKGLLAGLPLTPEKLKASNGEIRNALISLGRVYLNELEDYPSAIKTYEELRRRFPDDTTGMSEVLFNMYYSYTKTGNTDKAAQIKNQLQQNYPASRQVSILTTGKDPQSSRASTEVTKTYEGIYDLFLEGRFDEALAGKHQADSIYHTNYWSPQLLYIESVYYIKQREDSVAVNTLKLIQQQHPESPIAAKAANLIDVLGRRKQIEEELQSLQVERPADDSAALIPSVSAPLVSRDTSTVIKNQVPLVKPDTLAAKKNIPSIKIDAAVTVPPVPALPNARRDTTAVKRNVVTINRNEKLNRDSMVLKPVKTTVKPPPVLAPPVVKPTKDTVVSKPTAPVVPNTFSYEPGAIHFVAIVLNKVDNVFANEAKTAFTRYNRERYGNLPITIQLQNLDADNRLLLIGSFGNAQQAIEYVQKAKPVTAGEIVPWLKPDRYSYTIISPYNLEILKGQPDLEKYRKFLEKNAVKF